jgi:CheY-like chemotaxis protein
MLRDKKEGGARARVLVVDDEPLICTALRRMLASGHDIAVAHRADEALAVMRDGARYDAILCDLYLSGMDGIALHAFITAIDVEQARRMIFMSGAVVFTERERVFFATHPLIAKPFATGEVKTAIARVLRAE